jgi:hypothetical protein
MIDTAVLTYYILRARLIRDEKGEGVISAAIAVLIMAALGALMWIGIQELWGDASSQTSEQIAKIGS